MRLILLGILIVVILFFAARFYRSNQFSIPALRPGPSPSPVVVLGTPPPLLASPNPNASPAVDSNQPLASPVSAGIATYSDGQYGFTLQYPTTWQVGTITSPRTLTFTLASPDYLESSGGFPLITSGAAIVVEVAPVNQVSVDRYYSANHPASATNRKSATIAGLPAITYDSSGTGAGYTETVFIKNRNLYSIRYYYADSTAKNTYYPIYQNLLDSIVFSGT